MSSVLHGELFTACFSLSLCLCPCLYLSLCPSFTSERTTLITWLTQNSLARSSVGSAPPESVELHIHYCPLFATGWSDKNLSSYDHDRSPRYHCYLPRPRPSHPPSFSNPRLANEFYHRAVVFTRRIYRGRAKLPDKLSHRLRDIGNWKISTRASTAGSPCPI